MSEGVYNEIGDEPWHSLTQWAGFYCQFVCRPVGSGQPGCSTGKTKLGLCTNLPQMCKKDKKNIYNRIILV